METSPKPLFTAKLDDLGVLLKLLNSIDNFGISKSYVVGTH